MELYNLPNDKKKKIALVVASSFSAFLFVIWAYKFSVTIPSKITETKEDVEELSVVGSRVANVYLSVKTEIGKVGALMKERTEEIKNAKVGTTTVETQQEEITE